MITLYTARTGNGYRASILLEEAGLDYTAVIIGFEPGAERPPAFLAASPLAKIPAIFDDSGPDGAPVTLAESLAIALYIAEKSGRLLPATAEGRARAAEWGAIIVSGFGAAITGIFFARRLDAAAHEKLIAKYLGDLALGFAAMDRRLQDNPFLAGSAFSYADALAAPLPATATAFGVDLAPYANLLRWRDEVLQRPGVKAGLAVP